MPRGPAAAGPAMCPPKSSTTLGDHATRPTAGELYSAWPGPVCAGHEGMAGLSCYMCTAMLGSTIVCASNSSPEPRQVTAVMREQACQAAGSWSSSLTRAMPDADCPAQGSRWRS